jgi:hypothetical protein
MKELLAAANVTEWWKYRPGIAGPSGPGLYKEVATGSGWHSEGPLVVAFGGGNATVDHRLAPDYYRRDLGSERVGLIRSLWLDLQCSRFISSADWTAWYCVCSGNNQLKLIYDGQPLGGGPIR